MLDTTYKNKHNFNVKFKFNNYYVIMLRTRCSLCVMVDQCCFLSIYLLLYSAEFEPSACDQYSHVFLLKLGKITS